MGQCFSGDRCKHGKQTPCRAATQSSASFHRKTYPWAQQKIQTARNIPSKQNRENGLLQAIRACVACPCQTWFLTECPFPASFEESPGLGIPIETNVYRSASVYRTIKFRRVPSYMRPDRKRLHCATFNALILLRLALKDLAKCQMPSARC